MQTDEERPSVAIDGPAAEKSPRTIRLLTAVLLVATFACGTVTGAGLYRWAAPPPKPPPPPLVAPLPLEELHPTHEQWEQIREILEKHRPELEAVLDETYPKVRQITDKMDAEIRLVLTPEQRKRFDELKTQRQLRGRPPRGRPPRGRPPGPPPGPPPGSPPGPQQSGLRPPPGSLPPPTPPSASSL
jgi:Spy/CpxP family protein refolding chaperone